MVKEFSAALAPCTCRPPSISPVLTPGAVSASPWKLRPFGIRSNSSAVMLCAKVTLVRSSCLAASAVTFTVSVSTPGRNSASTPTVRPSRTMTSSTTTFWNVSSSKVME